ncbi:MAG: hypothetical protein LBR23_09775 [Spirochaetaceae bacterium]|nr:hypothetical protein [Spirochaetaceae bacterium]
MAKSDKGYRRGTPLGEFGIFLPYISIPAHRVTQGPMVFFLSAVVKDFFYLQWSVKLGWRRIPVIAADHPLDSTVPFNPGRARVYLDFINLWIRTLSMFLSTLGLKKGLSYCAEFLMYMGRCYRTAARVYRFRMTTTSRPDTEDRLVKTIRRCDPHYLCVPSLHIMVIALTWTYCRSVLALEKDAVPPEDAERFLGELFSGAVDITESVLYIKQHSVNCIPAALYMLNALAPDLFTVNDALALAGALFVEADDVTPENRALIKEHILFQFERFMLEGIYEDDLTAPVKRWLLGVST